jgi:FAD-dependent urate hydroxylase
MTLTCEVAIIGAGPYGLSAAAHLRGLDVRVFGETMSFWERNMPAGMLLRSYWEGSHISDPDGELTLDRYEASRGVRLERPVLLEDFVDYGRWFQRRVVPALDGRRVTRIDAAGSHLRLTTDDGEWTRAQRVVIATGIGSFAFRPPRFEALPPGLASHSSDHRDLGPFAGKRIAVIGGGQSALETAALLRERQADVEVIVRSPLVRWLRHGTRLHAWLHDESNLLRRILYPPSDIGPPGLNWLVDTPELFKRLPPGLHSRLARRAIRPAGAGWLRPRLDGTRITTGRSISSAQPIGGQVRLTLDDGTDRRVDHVLLATGYRVDVERCGLLAPELLRALRVVGGYPALTAGMESSVRGLHFVGAAAAGTFGPLMRFVAGTGYSSRALARRVLGRRASEAIGALELFGRWGDARGQAPGM